MVNADLMDAIDRSLRQARGRRAEPFGGVQVVMFGDPYQLAPVPPRGDEAHYIRDHYRSFWFFDAKVWVGERRRRRDHRHRLVRRRPAHPRARRHPPPGRSGVQGDAERRPARPGHRRHRAGAQRHRCAHAARSRRRRAPDHHARDAQRHRQQHQPPAPRPSSPDASRRRSAEISGDFGRGEASYPADVRAQAQGRRAGDVPAQRHRVVRRAAALGERHDRHGHAHRRRHGAGRGRRRGVRRRAGRVGEVPVRVRRRLEVAAPARSWPSSRSSRCASRGRSRSTSRQGKTYERAIVDLGSGAFAPGQTYVALQRLTSLDGLYLSRPLRPSDIRVDPDVQGSWPGCGPPRLDRGPELLTARLQRERETMGNPRSLEVRLPSRGSSGDAGGQATCDAFAAARSSNSSVLKRYASSTSSITRSCSAASQGAASSCSR